MLRLTPGSPAVQRRAETSPAPAPIPETTRVSPIGDSWTACNEAIISRNGAGSPVPGDDWTLQLAGALGFAHSTAPGGSGAASEIVVRCGYGGARTGTIKDDWLEITAADPSRKGDIKLLWPGRNDVGDATGDANAIAGVDAIIADSSNDLITLAIPYAGVGIAAGTAHGSILRQQRIARNYWRTKRRFVHPLNFDFMGLDDGDGSDAQSIQVAGMQAPGLMFQSAAAD
jgi:hypothetical protein